MSLKIIKKFAGKARTSESADDARRRAALSRARARAEALAKAKAAAKKRNEDGEGDQVDDINMDAESAEVLYTDKDANVQVLVGEDPVEGGIVVAVATAEKDNIEEEEVLASVTVGEGEGEGEGDGGTQETAESLKAKAIEEARAAIKARLKK